MDFINVSLNQSMNITKIIITQEVYNKMLLDNILYGIIILSIIILILFYTKLKVFNFFFLLNELFIFIFIGFYFNNNIIVYISIPIISFLLIIQIVKMILELEKNKKLKVIE